MTQLPIKPDDLGLKYTMTTPCSNCPFRDDRPFYLRPGRAQEIIDSMLVQDGSFSCHKTTEFDDEGTRVSIGNETHCAGILILLAKTDHLWDSLITRIAAMVGAFDPKRLHLTAPVYNTIEAFIEGVTFGKSKERRTKTRKKPRATGSAG